ncbi:MAG: 16S rRNA (cytidine(1402)-2'-O)-methyltransferase [Bacteroidota bacterium]|nr:16S rRNA (cytidine(1402)-2'-O)-methyltransferase [Bacteroidota bacterium]
MSGILYLIATPIGNYGDITYRALEVLKQVDIVVAEEFREGNKILRYYGIDKPLENLNEHNEEDKSGELLQMLLEGKNIGLISDSGTPVFSDPGRKLVKKSIIKKIRIIPLPGTSSLMPALIVSGFNIDKFLFYGWLSPKTEQRKKELRLLQKENRTIVLMDTPYRLIPLLKDLKDIFKDSRLMCIAYNLTMMDERIFYGTATELYNLTSEKKLKGEYVIVIGNKNN